MEKGMRGGKGGFTVVCAGFLDSWCPRPAAVICGAATRRIVLPRVIQLVEVILVCWNVSGSVRAAAALSARMFSCSHPRCWSMQATDLKWESGSGFFLWPEDYNF